VSCFSPPTLSSIYRHSDAPSRSRKYYFVQISTGESTWDVPTVAAPQVPTPGGTPVPTMSDPFSKPGQGGNHGNGYGDNYGNNQGNNYQSNGPDDAQEGDRGFKVSCWRDMSGVATRDTDGGNRRPRPSRWRQAWVESRRTTLPA
jgi:hypothetical protein